MLISTVFEPAVVQDVRAVINLLNLISIQILETMALIMSLVIRQVRISPIPVLHP
jgi:hypothetical protein